MKVNIRRNVFETNSSATHNCVIMSEDEYKKWEAQGLYYNRNNNTMITKAEALNIITENGKLDLNNVLSDYDYTEAEDDDEREAILQKCLRQDYDIHSYEAWTDREYLEWDTHYYTTKNGEKIVVMCQYGYDY